MRHTPCRALEPLTTYLSALNAAPELDAVEDLLNQLDITRDDLAEYIRFNDNGSRRYARNPITTSGWYELLVICWAPGQSSLIHDHAGSACAFRVIQGTGSETTYLRTPGGKVRPVSAEILSPGDVCASKDADIHRVANDTEGEDLITLHLYAPPLAVMNTYEEVPGAEQARRKLVRDALAAMPTD